MRKSWQSLRGSLENLPSGSEMMANNPAFKMFCQETTLHGWKYCFQRGFWHTVIWITILATSMISLGYLLIINIRDFRNATVAFNLESPTMPLKSVFFPSLVVCNMNALRQSFIYELKRDPSLSSVPFNELWRAVEDTFIAGKNTTQQDEILVQRILDSPTYKRLFQDFIYESLNASKISSNVVIHRFHDIQDFNITLDNLADYEKTFLPEIAAQYRDGELIPMINFAGSSVFYQNGFSTDMSETCIWLTPFVLEPSDPTGLRTMKPSCRNGAHNGLFLLIDAETFDYASTIGYGGEGFTISILHHLDIPIMKQSGVNIEAGQSVKVSVTPRLISTTDAVKRRFSPKSRQCYFQDEIKLRHFPLKDDYRYEMSNCLFEATLQRIEAVCGCTPKNFIEVVSGYEACTDSGKECMNELMLQIGDARFIDDDGLEKECLASCNDQKHKFSVTHFGFPNTHAFSQKPEFCVLVRKLIRSCNDARRLSLDSAHPGLCRIVFEVAGYDPEEFRCETIQSFDDLDSGLQPITILKKLVSDYAKKNVAFLNMFIPEPYVAKHLTEEKITEISFVGTVGGLMGLFLGFSFISVFEAVYLCCCFRRRKFCRYLKESSCIKFLTRKKKSAKKPSSGKWVEKSHNRY